MEKSGLHTVHEYELEGLALLLYWSMPYDYGDFQAYEQGVREYNITLPGDQYKINQQLEISVIGISNSTSLVSNTTGLANTTDIEEPVKPNEVITKPVMAKKFITDSKLYVSIEPGVGIIAVEGNNPARLDGEIIHVYGANKPVLYLFSKDGFIIDGASFKAFSKVFLVADSIHNYFSDDQLSGLSESVLQSKKYNNKLNSIIVENGIQAPGVELSIFANDFKCQGEIEAEKITAYFKEFSDNANTIETGCSVNAYNTVFELEGKKASLNVTAPIHSTTTEVKSDGDVSVNADIETNAFEANVNNLVVGEEAQIFTSRYYISDTEILESGDINIKAEQGITLEKGSKVLSGNNIKIDTNAINFKQAGIRDIIASKKDIRINAESLLGQEQADMGGSNKDSYNIAAFEGSIKVESKYWLETGTLSLYAQNQIELIANKKKMDGSALILRGTRFNSPEVTLTGKGEVWIEGFQGKEDYFNTDKLKISQVTDSAGPFNIGNINFPYSVSLELSNALVIFRNLTICSGILSVNTTGLVTFEGQVLSNGVNLLASDVEIKSKNAIGTEGEVIFNLVNNTGTVRLFADSSMTCRDLTIQTIDRGRINLFELGSANVEVNNKMIARTKQVQVIRTISSIEEEHFATKYPIKSYREIDKGLSSTLRVRNLILDVEGVYVSQSFVTAYERISFEGSNKAVLRVEGKHLNIIDKIYHPWTYNSGGWFSKSEYNPDLSGTVTNVKYKPNKPTGCISAGFYGMGGLYGNFEKIEGVCVNQGAHSNALVQPTAALQSIASVTYSEAVAIPENLKALTERMGRGITVLDSNRPVEDHEIIEVATDGLWEGSPNLEWLVRAQLPASSMSSLIEYDYLAIPKSISLHSCGIGIEHILEELNIPKEQIGKIFTKPDLQLDLIKDKIQKKTGLRDLSLIIREVKEYIAATYTEDATIREKDCGEIFWLLKSALAQRQMLGLQVGQYLPKEMYDKIMKPFIWLVYKKHKGIDSLVPVLYLTREIIKNSPARTGAFIGAGEWGVKTDRIMIAGGLFVQSGLLEAGNAAVFGKVVKTGPEDFTMKVNENMAVASLREIIINHQPGSIVMYTEVRSQAEIDIQEGKFYVLVNKDLLIQGAKVNGDITAVVNETAIIVPAKNYYAHYYQYDNGYAKVASVKNDLSKFSGIVNIVAGKGVFGEGIEVAGNSSVYLQSNTTIKLLHAVNMAAGEVRISKERWYGGESTYHTSAITQTVTGNIIGELELPLKEFISRSYDDTVLSAIQLYTRKLHMEAGTAEHKADIYIIPAPELSYQHEEIRKSSIGLKFDHGWLTFASQKKVLSYDRYIRQVESKVIIVDNGEAYFYASGKYYQIGTTVSAEGGKVTIIAPDGAEIGAAENEKLHVVVIDEKRTGIEFIGSKSELAVGFGFEIKKRSHEVIKFEPVRSSLKADNIFISISDGQLQTRGVLWEYRDAMIQALSHIDEPALAKYLESTKELSGSLGVRLGIKSPLLNAVEGTRSAVESLDMSRGDTAVNSAFGVFSAFVDWVKFIEQPVSGGIYVSGVFRNENVHISKVEPVVSEMKSTGKTAHNVTELHFTGTNIAGRSWYVNASKMVMANAFSSFEQRSSSNGFDLSIPIFASVTPGGSIGVSNGKIEVKDYVTMQVEMADELVFSISGKATLEGVAIEAGSVIMNMGELIIKAAQKVAKISGDGGNLGIGDCRKITRVINGIGFNYQRGETRWVDELTSVIGRDKVEIVVAGVMEIIGAMVANAERNADGSLTDKGNLKIKAAELVAENIYGHDDGVLFSASFNKGLEGGIIGNTYAVRFAYKDGQQLVMPTITGVVDAKVRGQINNNINNPKEEDKFEIRPISVIYAGVDFNKLTQSSTPEGFMENVKNGLRPITDIVEKVGNWFGWTQDTPVESAEALDEQEEEISDQEIEEMIDELDMMESEEEGLESLYDDVMSLYDKSEPRPTTKHELELIDEEVMKLAADIVGGEGKEAIRMALIIAVAKLVKSGMSIEEATEITLPKIIEAKKEYDRVPKIHKAALQLVLKGAKAGLKEVIRKCMADASCRSEVVGISKITSILDAIDITQEEQAENIRKFFKNNANEQSESKTQDVEKEAGGSGSGNDFDPEEEVRKLKESKLKDHEGGDHKGHTVEKHAGKDKEFLMNRINREEKLKDASSFKDYDTAESCVKKIIDKRIKKIIKWFKNAGIDEEEQFSGSFDEMIGYGMKKGENVLTPKNKAMVVLKKTKDGIKIVTSYPID